MKKTLITLAILTSLLWPQPLEFQLPPKSEPEPLDLASNCQKFPCYTAKKKSWISQKYRTKNKVIKPEEWRLKKRKQDKSQIPLL